MPDRIAEVIAAQAKAGEMIPIMKRRRESLLQAAQWRVPIITLGDRGQEFYIPSLPKVEVGRCSWCRSSIQSITANCPNCGGPTHDDNCRCFFFECPNGHSFGILARNVCPKCDWKGKEYCSICKG